MKDKWVQIYFKMFVNKTNPVHLNTFFNINKQRIYTQTGGFD